MLPLIELTEASVIAGGRTLLGGVSFSLFAGETVRLSGPNGGGKTTLLRLLAGQIAPVSGSRRYFFGGQTSAVLTSAVQARRVLNVVGPDAEAFYLTRDWEQTVRDVLLAGAEGEQLRLWEASDAQLARLQEVAALVGVEPLLERDFRTLSHGQRRRVLLGRALMPAPPVLLLDEFTDGLSEQARADLGGVLRRVHAAGVALVLATHRPEEVPGLNWRTVTVSNGEVGSSEWSVETTGKSARLSVLQSAHRAPHPAPLVHIQNAEVYRNGNRALGPLSWTWQVGQHWLVTGENGSGKSTLARLVAGDFYPSLGGQVTRPFLVRDVQTERRRAIGLVSAEAGIRQRFSLSGRRWTGRDVIASAFGGTEGFSEKVTPEQWAVVEALATRLELEGLLGRDVQALSQGQLRRLLLARAVIHRPHLLILDEGLDFVDAHSRELFLGLLPDLSATGTHLMLIAHRASDALPGLTHHLHLSGGVVATEAEL